MVRSRRSPGQVAAVAQGQDAEPQGVPGRSPGVICLPAQSGTAAVGRIALARRGDHDQQGPVRRPSESQRLSRSAKDSTRAHHAAVAQRPALRSSQASSSANPVWLAKATSHGAVPAPIRPQPWRRTGRGPGSPRAVRARHRHGDQGQPKQQPHPTAHSPAAADRLSPRPVMTVGIVHHGAREAGVIRSTGAALACARSKSGQASSQPPRRSPVHVERPHDRQRRGVGVRHHGQRHAAR